MTDETQNDAPDMNDFLTEESFDFFSLIEEDNGFPESEVEVFMNEAAAHKRVLAMRKLAKLDVDNPEHHALMHDLIAEIKALEAKIEASRVVFHLRGVDTDKLEAARVATNEKFEERKKQRMLADKSIQRYLTDEDQLNAMKYFNALANSLYVTKVVNSKGIAQASPGVDRMYAFLEKGPQSQRQKFLLAVADLKVDASQFEARLDDSFFPKS